MSKIKGQRAIINRQAVIARLDALVDEDLPKNKRRMRALEVFKQVLASGRVQIVDSMELLPGDVVVLHPGVLPCDVTLIRCVWGWLSWDLRGARLATLAWRGCHKGRGPACHCIQAFRSCSPHCS